MAHTVVVTAAGEFGEQAVGARCEKVSPALLRKDERLMGDAHGGLGEPAAVVRAAAEQARDRSNDRESYLFARRAEGLLAEL